MCYGFYRQALIPGSGICIFIFTTMSSTAVQLRGLSILLFRDTGIKFACAWSWYHPLSSVGTKNAWSLLSTPPVVFLHGVEFSNIDIFNLRFKF